MRLASTSTPDALFQAFARELEAATAADDVPLSALWTRVMAHDEVSVVFGDVVRTALVSGAARRWNWTQDAKLIAFIEDFLRKRVRQQVLLHAATAAACHGNGHGHDRARAFLRARGETPVDAQTWDAYELLCARYVLLFFRDKPLPGLFRQLDVAAPLLDPSACIVCARGRYILHHEEGCFICNHAACRHQLLQLVDSRVSCGTGYSNELVGGARSNSTAATTASSSSPSHPSPPPPSVSTTSTPSSSSSSSAAVFACSPALPCAQLSSQSAERLAHFREVLAPFRGTDTGQGIPRSVIDVVVRKLTERRVVRVASLRFPMVRALLKELDLAAYMPRTHAIMHILGHHLPYMPDDVEELFCHLFQRIEMLWPAQEARAACFQYHFIFHQLCVLTGHPEFLPYIILIKDPAKRQVHQETLQHILFRIRGGGNGSPHTPSSVSTASTF